MRRSTLDIGTVLLSFMVLAASGCGGGGGGGGSGGGGTADSFRLDSVTLTTFESEVPREYHILGSGFEPVGGTVNVYLLSLGGTPFRGGTAGTFTAVAVIDSATDIRGLTPYSGLVHDAEATIRVELQDGRHLDWSQSTVHITAPRVTGITPHTTSGSAAGDFTISGSGFDQVTRAVDVEFTARDGTPFLFGRFGSISVLALSPFQGTITGRFPSVSVAQDTYVDRVDVTFLSGAGATLDLTADPIVLRAPTKVLSSDGAVGDLFGSSAACDGMAIVGAHAADGAGAESGAAYVFVPSGGGWTQEQRLSASDGAAGDFFGSAVSLSGDTAIVSAIGDDDKGSGSGSAYVFVRSAGTWSQQQKLLAPDGVANDFFGAAVAVSGDTAIVTAPYDDDKGTNSGSAYVFFRVGGVWAQQQKLLAPDGGPDDHFGFSAAIDGDVVLVGATEDDEAAVNAGAAYVFTRTGTVWSLEAKLLASDAAAGDGFGFAVGLSGSTALVGAPYDQDNGLDSGSAYAFRGLGALWAQESKLVPADGAAGDQFGRALGVSGDSAIVGADGADANGIDSGAAYVFLRSAGTWHMQEELTPPDGNAGQGSGHAVALSAHAGLVSAWLDDDNGTGSGSAYIY